MLDILDHLFTERELYHEILEPVQSQYHISFSEMTVLLFLANHKEDQAKDIVDKRGLTKSAVSMAVRSLREKELVTGEFINNNYRSVHLKLCEKAKPIVNEAKKAQETFKNILFEGFTNDEEKELKKLLVKMNQNIYNYHINK